MTRNDFNLRILQMIPGLLVWITLIGGVVLSFIQPLWVIYFIIVFDLYWVFRIIYFIPFLFLSWWRYRRALKTDWATAARTKPGYDRIRHLIFLPTYREDLGVIVHSLEALRRASESPDRFYVVIAGEERDRERFEIYAKEVHTRYDGVFAGLWTTMHPKNLSDEIPGKGSNLHFSAREVVPQLLEKGLQPEHLVVSSFDIDTVIHPQYFSCLTYLYLSVPDPTHASYQPVPLYNNNLWESPAAVRVAMFGTTFWLMTELARPENMMTFSSHSMSLKMLMDVGYWQKDIVSEDSRIFLQGLVRYHGDYRVVPIHLPVSMDTVMTGSYWKALIALYKQLRRWAWGVENFPFMARAFARDPQMPRQTKFVYLFKQLEGMYTWATAPMLILLLGRLPFWVAPENMRGFTIFQNTPFTLQWLMRIAMIGVFVSAGMAMTLLPSRPRHVPRHQALFVVVLQWLLLPVTFVLFGAIPAIDAQTRLMLGRPLGFNVTAKRRVPPTTV